MLKLISENRAFDGVQRVYSHRSEACDCEMAFGLYLPAEAAFVPVPLLTYLSGLTCTHANAMEKSGAQRWAAEEGIAVLFPDTSPRGNGVPDDEAGELPAAFVVIATGQSLTSEAVMAHAAERLANYKHIRQVTFMDAIPKSASGKILRRELRDGLANG